MVRYDMEEQICIACYGMLWCGMLWCGMLWCGMLWYGMEGQVCMVCYGVLSVMVWYMVIHASRWGFGWWCDAAICFASMPCSSVS